MPANTQSPKGAIQDKWGVALDYAGFQSFPNLLLVEQRNLGISATELVVLLHLNRYWWTRNQDPYPKASRIAEQMGVTRRSVERCLLGLEQKGLIERRDPRKISGKTARPISLLPLVERLGQIAVSLRIKILGGGSSNRAAGPSRSASDGAAEDFLENST